MRDLGIVVIGRNEGERLRRCLTSLHAPGCRIVYVDSGSTDGSVQLAADLGAICIELARDVPFTAARARNAGLKQLFEVSPGVAYVQFVDGDCEVAPGWLGAGRSFLSTHPQHAAVFGTQRERHPEASIYNRLCDLELSGEPGDTKSCGGNAMFRAEAIRAAGGYRAELIAGEEPELCVRLRASGWKVRRLANAMITHDANMSRFSQWWRRTRRGGYAFAQGAWLHGAPPERHWVRETSRALAYGAALPVGIAVASLFHPWALLLAFVYPAQVLRLALRDRKDVQHATFLVLGRLPEAIGALQFYADRFRRRNRQLIEYK